MHRVGEGEVAEVVVADHAVLDQLVRLGQGIAHVDHVEVPDVGAVERVQLRAERVVLAEGRAVHPIVRLAPEVEGLGVEIDPVFLAGDLAGGEIVEILDAARQVRILVRPAVARLQRGRDVGIAVLLGEAHQHPAIERPWIHLLERLAVAPLPVLDEVAEELRRPADSAFEECEPQLREAARDTAEEDRLGHRVAGSGEVTDVVVDEVRRRVPQPLITARAVEGGRDAELLALFPDGFVVVLAVDREHVVVDGEAVPVRIGLRRRRHASRHPAAEHPDLRSELLGNELELFDGFVGMVHRDDRGRRHPITELAEVVRGDDVVRANHRAPGGVVADPRHAQPGGGIDDGVVAAELVQALIEQARHHRGGAVERVRRLAGPEARLGDAPPPALAERHAERVFGGLQCGEPSVGGLVAADPAHPLGEDGVELDPVPVAVDDRVAEARADLRGSLVAVAAHVPSSDDDGFVFSAATGGRPGRRAARLSRGWASRRVRG